MPERKYFYFFRQQQNHILHPTISLNDLLFLLHYQSGAEELSLSFDSLRRFQYYIQILWHLDYNIIQDHKIQNILYQCLNKPNRNNRN